MCKTYSEDLRKKVVKYVKNTGDKLGAEKIFNIGISTIYRWLKLDRSGSLKAKHRTSFHHVVDVEVLQEYVSQHPDATITEIACALKLGRQTVFRWLGRLKITRKKRRHFTKNVMRH